MSNFSAMSTRMLIDMMKLAIENGPKAFFDEVGEEILHRQSEQPKTEDVSIKIFAPTPAKKKADKRVLSAEGRANIVAALKKRWAEKKAAVTETTTETPGKRHRISSAGKKSIARAQKKRWAEFKKKKAAKEATKKTGKAGKK